MKLIPLTASVLIGAAALCIGHLNTSEAGSVEPLIQPNAEAKTLKIDSGHSSVLFRIQHNEAAYFYGRFNEVAGEVVFDEDDPAKCSVEVIIKAGSVDTNSANRDKHVLSPDFLDAKQFPELKFKSKKVERDGAVWKATGDLMLHGASHEITIDFEKTGEGKGRRGETLMGFHSRFEIERADWGMEYMVGPLSNEIELTVSLEVKGS
jgi:polyisoprenoid-binding protein YceI